VFSTLSSVRKVVVGLVLGLVVVLAVPVYFTWGWSRAESACGIGQTVAAHRRLTAEFDGADSGSVRLSWHASEGFTCTYSNGKTRASYWF
jgi:hypothetical protein